MTDPTPTAAAPATPVPSPVGAARDGSGVTVEVGPGGTLRSLTIPDRSMRMGGDTLAATIVGLIHSATAEANRRTRFAMADALHGLTETDLERLGLGVATDLADAVEDTTPDTWMR